MKEKQDNINRRDFLRTAGTAGLASVFASTGSLAGQKDPNATTARKEAEKQRFPQVPKRKLGKTGVEVSCLSHGIMYDVGQNQIVLRKALDWGVTYWDTANGYAGGNSEIGIGKFLAKNPNLRKDLFIVTKASGAKTAEDVEKRLQTSLKRMNTKYIDLYYGVHALSDPAQLTDKLKQWAESAKKRKLIRLFGFSTHSNMAKCLVAAAGSGWIDAIMTSYNFRLMQDPRMRTAVAMCHKAGIGLIAMKTQAKKIKTQADRELTMHFLQRGFTEGQAKIKVVLKDKRISSACVGMENVARLTSNVAAVLDETRLLRADMEVFKEYAQATCDGYCAGCADICNAAVPQTPYISEVMRYLMYYNSYGHRQQARELFAKIPADIRSRLKHTDYTAAQARCPQHLPIEKLMAEAVSKLA